MSDRAERLGKWVSLANETTQGFLAERIVERRNEAEPTLQDLFDRLIEAWGIAPPN